MLGTWQNGMFNAKGIYIQEGAGKNWTVLKNNSFHNQPYREGIVAINGILAVSVRGENVSAGEESNFS